MTISEQINFLYNSLAKTHNALKVLKFAKRTFELDNSLTTFIVVYVDSYYSMYTNLSHIFDSTADVMNLHDILKIKSGIKDADRVANIKAYDELAKTHSNAIDKLSDVRNGAIAHLDLNIDSEELQQNTEEIQKLVADLFILFKSLKGFVIDYDEPLLIKDVTVVINQLGQKELWDGFISSEFGLPDA